MSAIKFTSILSIAVICWLSQSVDQAAEAQISVQLGTPTYYGNQPVYRGNGIVSPRAYSQPSYRYSQPYPGAYGVTPQQYNSGYRGYSSPNVYGNSYQSYRPNYSNPPVYGNGYNYGSTNGYYYGTPSQQRGAIVGGTIGSAVGGNRGASIGAAIGAAVQSK